MNRFSDMNIQTSHKGFEGDKIKISKVLNREILVEQFKLENSKFEGKGKCLYMQIALNNDKRVIFTGSTVLIDMIKQVPEDKFPFTTTIVENNERYMFT